MENLEGKIIKIKEYGDLTTAPEGKIIVYQLNFIDSSGRKHSDVMVTFDSGKGGEEAWGVGVDLFDALEVASMQYYRYFDDFEDEDPFQELLYKLKWKEEK